MRGFGRAVRTLMVLGACGAALVVGTGTAFLLRPGLFVGPRGGAFLIERFGAAYRPRWERLHVSAASLGGGRHRYGVRAEGLCLGDPRGAVAACFEDAGVSIVVAYGLRGPSLELVESLVVEGRTLRVDAARLASGRGGGLSLGGLGGAEVGEVRVRLPVVEILGPAGGLKGLLEASGEGSGVRGRADFAVRAGPVRRAKLEDCRLAAPGEGVSLTCRFEALLLTGGDVRLAPFKVLSGSIRMAAGPGRSGSPGFHVDFDAKTLRFEDVVAGLKGTPYAVPAPFHALKGPLRLELAAFADPGADPLRADVRLGVDLAGARQKLAGEVTAKVAVSEAASPRRRYAVDAEALIREAVFVLPKLDIASVPTGTLDPRIRTGAEAPALRDALAPSPAPAAAPPVRARLAVRTLRPLLLLSNLAKDPVPVSVDLVAGYPPPSAAGSVGVKGFWLELFRGRAFVERFDVRLSSGSPHGTLDGLIVYKAEEVLVHIRLRGTTEMPLVEFSSEPPLKREQILALLVFGKTPAQLDPEETASVANTHTALESRSFGLASLYMIGATPIEHVAYDPGSKKATVKLRLPGGALLQLGSDFDGARGLRLRQPLSAHWAIQSELSEQGPETRFGTTFLEWFNRY